jgi:hypothetical protein
MTPNVPVLGGDSGISSSERIVISCAPMDVFVADRFGKTAFMLAFHPTGKDGFDRLVLEMIAARLRVDKAFQTRLGLSAEQVGKLKDLPPRWTFPPKETRSQDQLAPFWETYEKAALRQAREEAEKALVAEARKAGAAVAESRDKRADEEAAAVKAILTPQQLEQALAEIKDPKLNPGIQLARQGIDAPVKEGVFRIRTVTIVADKFSMTVVSGMNAPTYDYHLVGQPDPEQMRTHADVMMAVRMPAMAEKARLTPEQIANLKALTPVPPPTPDEVDKERLQKLYQACDAAEGDAKAKAETELLAAVTEVSEKLHQNYRQSNQKRLEEIKRVLTADQLAALAAERKRETTKMMDQLQARGVSTSQPTR